MSVQERPLTINGVTFNNYESFRDYVFAHRATKEDSIHHLEKKMNFFEQKYNMSTSAFIHNVVGTPADDTPDFIGWLCHYESYCKLTNGSKG
ncbi:hypothetical protein KKG61_06435 [bacterium]|nr:hypothetical protein [bacterium]MBU1599722.1 hypothetical protein [bacterium]